MTFPGHGGRALWRVSDDLIAALPVLVECLAGTSR